MIIEFSTLLAFVTAMLIVFIAPGVDMIYIASNSINKSYRAGLYAAAGVSIGVAIQASAATFGITALFLISPVIFEILRWVGVIYLCYLGIRILMSSSEQELAPKCIVWKPMPIVLKGIAINLLNPKMALFFLAFLPQFVNPAKESIFLQLAIFGLIFSVGAILWCAFQALLFARIGSWFEKSKSFNLWQRRVTGMSFIGFAGLLSLSDLRR